MTDGYDSSKCEVTEEYLDKHFDSFEFTEDYYLIEKIGIQLSLDEALCYLELPEFHRAYLENVLKWHEIRAGLYNCLKDKISIRRFKDYTLIKNSTLSISMKIKDISVLVFPFLSNEAIRRSEIFLKDVIGLIKEERLTSVNLKASELFMPAVASQEEKRKFLFSGKERFDGFPYTVVNLLRVESLTDFPLGCESAEILTLWRQYLEVFAAVPVKKANKNYQVKINPEWQALVNKKYRSNKALSHLAICRYLATELGEKVATIRRKTVNPKTNATKKK